MRDQFLRIVAKTANYTIRPDVDQSGTCFTNRGAGGAVTFTLPTPGIRCKGWYYRFYGIAGQNIIVAVPTVDTAVEFNDAAADSLALQTAGQLIGGMIEAFCDGTSWIVYGMTPGHTFTVAT